MADAKKKTKKPRATKPDKGFISAPGLNDLKETLRLECLSKELVFPKPKEDVLETARGMFPDLDIRLRRGPRRIS